MLKLKFFLLVVIPAMALLVVLPSCQKTDSPFGIDAPNGLDVPSPTPQAGSINCYVEVGVTDLVGVTVAMVDPAGNTQAVNTTQPSIDYAPFNFNSLTNGVWNAVVPAQSITNVSGGTTVKYTFGNSDQPLTVSGSGTYPVIFSGWAGNNVYITPSSQAMATALPDFLPTTINYLQTGNLNIPVSVAMTGINNLAGWSYLDSPYVVMGGGVTQIPVTIEKNSCLATPVTLSLAASDFIGTSISTSNATITRGWPIPVTLQCTKSMISGFENFVLEVQTGLDCGITVYNVGFSYDSTSTSAAGTVASGQWLAKSDGGQNYTVSCSVTLPNGTVLSGNSGPIANIGWNSWTVLAAGSY